MYKEDLALNNLQWLICHKTKPNQTPVHTNICLIHFLDFFILRWFADCNSFCRNEVRILRQVFNWLGFLSLFNGISTPEGLLMLRIS